MSSFAPPSIEIEPSTELPSLAGKFTRNTVPGVTDVVSTNTTGAGVGVGVGSGVGVGRGVGVGVGVGETQATLVRTKVNNNNTTGRRVFLTTFKCHPQTRRTVIGWRQITLASIGRQRLQTMLAVRGEVIHAAELSQHCAQAEAVWALKRW